MTWSEFFWGGGGGGLSFNDLVRIFFSPGIEPGFSGGGGGEAILL